MNRSPFTSHLWLFVIAVAFVLLALLYSLATPFFEKTDEIYHVAYVKHLADGHGLPSLDPHNPARQEATQPPLTYLIGAALTAWIDTGDMSSLTRLNPYYRPIWDGVFGDNRNRYMHTVDELAPRRGAALAVRLLRCLSITMGTATVVCTYLIARLLYPQRRWLSTGAAAFCAFNPHFLYVSGTVNNDVVVAAMCGLTGLAIVCVLRAPRPGTRHAAVIGIGLGASLLAKVSALVMLPVALGVVIHVARRARAGQGQAWVLVSLKWLGVILLCAGAISGWWYIRNAILLDGDLTGTAVHIAKWGRRGLPLTFDELRLELQGLEESYWAVFGLNSIPIARWINLILFGVDRLTVFGGIVLVALQWTGFRSDRDTRTGLLLLALWVLGSLASVFYWMVLMRGVNLGRLLYPALPAIALFMALPFYRFTPSRWRPVVMGTTSTALCALAVACPFVYILPNYLPPPILKEADVGPFTERLDADFQGQITLLGYSVSQEKTWPGDRLAITLTYQAAVPFGIDYTVFVHLVDEHGNIVVQQDTYTGMGRYPTTVWEPGQIIADTFYLTLPEWTPVPNHCTFEVGFYDRETQTRLLVVDEKGQAVGDSVWFYRIRTVPPPGPDIS